jgi:hypothetical protein
LLHEGESMSNKSPKKSDQNKAKSSKKTDW